MTTSTPIRSPRADLALELGILGIALPFLPIGPVAWAFARRELRAVQGDPPDISEIGALQAAQILGLAGSLLTFGALALLTSASWAVWLAARASF